MKIQRNELFLLAVVLLLAIIMPLSLPGQNTDSLVLKLAGTKEDTSRVNLLLKLVSVYRNSDPKKTELYLSRALALSEEKNFDKGIAYSNFYFAVLFGQTSQNRINIRLLDNVLTMQSP
jgi:hypothetical protein